jgi:hypothetical protein
MIRTVSDFLEELKKRGQELIKKYHIVNHPVLIGDMYEGLTQQILDKALFDGLNLKIVGGKIKNSTGQLSSEIDCMVVEGDGEQIPFTEKYIYHFKQVIAVIQVKKSLYTDGLDDSYNNLKSVMNISQQPETDGEAYMINIARDSYRALLRMELPNRSELDQYSEMEKYMYHTLIMESYFPVRIVLGYYGFKTEYKFRDAFANMISNKANSGKGRGYGANSLPNLIICGDFSIIKNNGMPFGMPFQNEEFYWPIYMSAPNNPLYYLIEIIWTRLSYKYQISSTIFGDDFDLEPVHRYINCKVGQLEAGKYGWMYSYSPFTQKQLAETKNEKIKWQPAFLTQDQFQLITMLCMQEAINVETDEEFRDFIKDYDSSDFIQSLLKTGLVQFRNNELRLLTDECSTMILPDGRFCAGENKNGEMLTWLSKNQ